VPRCCFSAYKAVVGIGVITAQDNHSRLLILSTVVLLRHHLLTCLSPLHSSSDSSLALRIVPFGIGVPYTSVSLVLGVGLPPLFSDSYHQLYRDLLIIGFIPLHSPSPPQYHHYSTHHSASLWKTHKHSLQNTALHSYTPLLTCHLAPSSLPLFISIWISSSNSASSHSRRCRTSSNCPMTVKLLST
jgi:hypothetical protein